MLHTKRGLVDLVNQEKEKEKEKCIFSVEEKSSEKRKNREEEDRQKVHYCVQCNKQHTH